MALLVLLRYPEIHVEEQEGTDRRGLRLPAVEHLPEPFRVDELVVLRESLEGQGLVSGPLDPPFLVGPDSRVA